MASFKSKRPGVANRWDYPQSKPTVNPVGSGKRKRREIISFDVRATHGDVRGSKKTALLEVKATVRSTTFTDYAGHGATSHYKGPKIMGNRAKGVSPKPEPKVILEPKSYAELSAQCARRKRPVNPYKVKE